ncbi:MAG TPA: SWIM zinc finger family protein [Candidatus Paceibacterota bacterium]|nr:SWIM zinc finger family protein [Candidatus Pacearchaeota archaeon]HRZ51237.1 SWIM zinc finger family protein [Candidatus Paceibacterota bacterium]HSA36959.1 SWIM zinc finger family protein [Candidatus Paceibacterota bacterium]
MIPQFDLDKIKFGVDEGTWKRAVEIYEAKKVTKFTNDFGGYSAVVLGTHPYSVSVSSQHYDRGNCDCYMGQQDILCKHMVAVAIYAILRGNPIKEEEKQQFNQPKCSGKLGELTALDLIKTKKAITEAMRNVKAYSGPSRTWFAYQNSLSEGCNRLSKIICELPISLQTTTLLVDLLLRLDKRVCSGGVDDSDGTVGGLMTQTVEVLKDYAKLDPDCAKSFKKLCGVETCFGWEKPLVEIYNSKKFANLQLNTKNPN